MQLRVRLAFSSMVFVFIGLCLFAWLQHTPDNATPQTANIFQTVTPQNDAPQNIRGESGQSIFSPVPSTPIRDETALSSLISPPYASLIFILCFCLVTFFFVYYLVPPRKTSGQLLGLPLPEERLRLILQTVKEGVIGMDKQGNISFANEYALTTLGYTEGDFLGRNLHETVHSTLSYQNPCKNELCPLRKALQFCTESIEINDLFFMRKDGSIFPVHILVNPMFKNGKDLGVSLIFSDITDQYDLQEQLWAIYNATNDGYFIFSQDLRLLSCNPAAKNLFGIHDEQEIIGNFYHFSPYTQPDGDFSQRKFLEVMHKTLETGYSSFDWVHQNLQGEHIPCEVFLERILLRGEFALFACVHDQRKIKNIQNALEMERHQLQNILDTSPFGLTFTYDGEVTFANQYMVQHFGVKSGQKTPRKVYVPRIGDTSDFVVSTVLMDALAVQSIDIDNNPCDVLLTSVTGKLHGMSGVLSWVVDISDVKKAERESALARKAAEEAARAKSEFLAHMSHEIRTPLNAIQGMCHLLQQTPLNGTQQQYLHQLRSSSNNLLDVVNSVLDFSRSESGQLKLEYTPFLLTDITTRIYDVLSLRAEEKGLEFSIDIAAAIPAVLQGDPLRIGQILLNLTSNAIKFTEHGSVKITLEVDEILDDTYQLHFTITDTGIGLSAESLRDVFQPFIQADRSTTRKYGGTGLGLAICKSLVDMMQGSIWVESTLGHGCSFHVRLPLKRLLYSMEALQENPPEALLVAPHTSQENYTSILKTLGFQVQYVSTWEQAVLAVNTRAQKTPVNLLCLDGHPVTKPPAGAQLQNFVDGFSHLATRPVLLCVLSSQQGALLHEFKTSVPFTVLEKKHSEDSSNASDIFNALSLYFAHLTANRISSDLSTLQCYEESLARIAGSKILLVEDNDTNQEIATALLTQMGMQVTLANNGLEAIQKVMEDDFDLVLMDIQMPVMDGLEASRSIRSLPDDTKHKLPIIALTAHVGSEQHDKSLEAGMNAHLTKPLEPELLTQALVQWIDPNNPHATRHPALPKPVEKTAGQTSLLPATLPGINIEKGLTHVSNNTELYRKIIERFPERYGKALQELRLYLKEDKKEEARRLAHTIKGISATLGASDFSNAMHTLEVGIPSQTCTEAQLQDAEGLLEIILDGIKTLLPSRELQTTPQTANVSAEQCTHALQVLANLETWLETDLFRASTELNQLAPFFEQRTHAENFQNLSQALQDFDIDKIHEYVQKLTEFLKNMEREG